MTRADEFEVDNGDGTITIMRGNPRYCPIEHAHDPHEYTYTYLNREGETVVGAYGCFGDPAPWVDICEYCEDHPAEPNLPCCDNEFCKASYYKEIRDGRY